MKGWVGLVSAQLIQTCKCNHQFIIHFPGVTGHFRFLFSLLPELGVLSGLRTDSVPCAPPCYQVCLGHPLRQFHLSLSFYHVNRLMWLTGKLSWLCVAGSRQTFCVQVCLWSGGDGRLLGSTDSAADRPFCCWKWTGCVWCDRWGYGVSSDETGTSPRGAADAGSHTAGRPSNTWLDSAGRCSSRGLDSWRNELSAIPSINLLRWRVCLCQMWESYSCN